MPVVRNAGIGLLSAIVLVSGVALTSPASAATIAQSSSVASNASIAAKPFPGKSATQVKKLAAAAAGKATAVRVTGKEPDKTFGTISFDIRIGASSAAGTFNIAKPKGGQIKFIRVGNTLYLQGNAAAWGKEAAPGGSLYGKWVKVGRSDKDYLSFARLTTIKFWASGIGALNVSRRYTGPKINSTPTVRLYQPGKKGGNIYVAASGPAYPLLVATTDKKTRIGFSLWNKAVSFSAPPTDQVIDINS